MTTAYLPPLYPRGRPLKNLLTDFFKRYNVDTLIGEYNPLTGEFTPTVLTDEARILYEHAVHHWYFADINYDTDEEFIFRFNVVFEDNVEKFIRIVNSVTGSSLFTSSEELTGSDTRGGTDTKTLQKSGANTEKQSGTDTFNKGISTTSVVETENEGKKLTRSTPNENLSVTGGSTTTVTDTGSDSTTFGKKVDYIISEEHVDTTVYGNETAREYVKTNKDKLSPDKLRSYMRMKSVFEEFAYCFENLFLEVL